MSMDSDLTEYRDQYDAFARTGGTDPNWYQRYSTVTRYLEDVQQRLRSRSGDSSLRREDIPGLPDWGIAEGDVEGFLEMVWHSVDNGVAGLGQGRVYDQHWVSMQRFSHDGMDLAALTAAMIRDPELETQNGRATEWFVAWRAENPELRGRVPRAMIFRLIAGLEPETYTSVVDRNHLFGFAKKLGLSSTDASGSWYRMNELVLDRLHLPSADPIMRNCYVWDLSARLAREDKTTPETPTRPFSYWAIAADPRRYDVVRAIAESDVDAWTTGGSALAPGDHVAFWKYKGSEQHRGVVGLGVITSEPYQGPPSESPYWVRQPDDDDPVPRVDVRYVRLPDGPLWLEDEPWLEELSVARAQGGTVFSITPEQWTRLMDRIGGWPGGNGGAGRRSINDISRRDSVLAAVAEYDRLGQDAFLEKYGFAMAERFFLEIDGRRYDSKAIAGAAYGYEFPDRGRCGRRSSAAARQPYNRCLSGLVLR